MISVYLAAKEMFGKTTSNKKSHDTEQWLSQIHIAMCQHRECAPLQVDQLCIVFISIPVYFSQKGLLAPFIYFYQHYNFFPI